MPTNSRVTKGRCHTGIIYIVDFRLKIQKRQGRTSLLNQGTTHRSGTRHESHLQSDEWCGKRPASIMGIDTATLNNISEEEAKHEFTKKKTGYR
jgi:hypothetical protein